MKTSYPQKPEIYREWADACLDMGNLSKWEDSFVVSIVDRLDRGRQLSEAQAEKLESIYAEKT